MCGAMASMRSGALSTAISLSAFSKMALIASWLAAPSASTTLKNSCLQRLPVHAQLGGSQGVVERHGGAVLDALVDAILVVVASGVGLAEGLEGALAHLAVVDGRAGEAEVEGVGQRSAHVDAQVAFLRAVRLVDQDDDVAAQAARLGHAVKLVDEGDDEPAVVAVEQLLQMMPASAAPQPGKPNASRFCIIWASSSRRSTTMRMVGFSPGRAGGAGGGRPRSWSASCRSLACAIPGRSRKDIGSCGNFRCLERRHHPLHHLAHCAHLMGAHGELEDLVVVAIEDDEVVKDLQQVATLEEALGQALQAIVVPFHLPAMHGLGVAFQVGA